MGAPTRINMLNLWLRQRVPQLTRTWVRQKVSPRLTGLYAKLGLVDRTKLTENLQKIEETDQAQLLDQLARNGILKWRFYKQLAPNTKASVKDISHFMLSGRIDDTMINAVAENLELAAIRSTLAEGIFRNGSASLPRLVNQATSLAFYAALPAAIFGYFMATGLSFYSVFFGAAGYGITSRIIQRQKRPDTVLDKFERFNPVSKLGRLIGFGSRRLFWPSVLIGAGLFGLAAYEYVSAKFYPAYQNERMITITSDNGRINAIVCDNAGHNCRTSELFTYSGDRAVQRARDSERAIQAAINSHDLFLGGLSVVENEIRVGDAWKPSWLPSWLPLGSTTLIDLTRDGLTEEARNEQFSLFFRNLRSSGIMPTSDDLARADIQRLTAQMRYNIFRDPSLSHRLTLASRYLQVDNYVQAEALAREIINYNLTVTASRDMYTDEAVFLIVDSNRIQAMRFFDPARLDAAMTELVRNIDNLQSLEQGYLARYNYEMLKTCTIGEQFFPRRDSSISWTSQELCAPELAATYRDNATFVHNQFSPTFNDNFLAVRTFLMSGKYNLTIASTGANIDRARQEYQQALALIELIDSCSAPINGNHEQNWQLYYPYMRPADQAIGETLGYEAGLFSFSARCEAGRTLRGDLRSDLPLLGRPGQFDPILFRVFRAQAYQGLAETEMRLADSDSENRLAHLQQASSNLRQAYNTANLIMEEDMAKFYSVMYEERETYYSVLVDYSAALLRLYVHSPQSYTDNLAEAQRLASEVASQRGEEPLDILYLRAQMVLADIAMINNDRQGAATRIRTVLDQIGRAESALEQGQTLPPHYRYLRERAEINSIILNP